MFVVKVYCVDLTVNVHHEHCIVPTNYPWVSEDDQKKVRAQIKEPIPRLTPKEHHLQLAFGTINQLSSRLIANTIMLVALTGKSLAIGLLWTD